MASLENTCQRAHWNVEQDSVFLKEMIYQVNVLGKRAQSGFKKEAWDAALSKLRSQCGVIYDRSQVKSRAANVSVPKLTQCTTRFLCSRSDNY